MQIEISPFGKLLINVQTKPSGGTTAVNQHVADPHTVVYYGDLHARVFMQDIGVEVTMDPVPGEWQNASWARSTAWEAVLGELTAAALEELLLTCVTIGRDKGIRSAQKRMRKALGLQVEG